MIKRDVDGCICFAGGGSGGHLFPGLAVAEQLVDERSIVFARSGRPIEDTVLAADQRFRSVTLPTITSTQLFRRPIQSVRGWFQAKRAARDFLQEERPAVVVGLGGFASVPVVRAAQQQGIPTVVLEQNAVVGRANWLLARRANVVCTAFECCRPQTTGEVVWTGNPVRADVLHERPAPQYNATTLLILGGSQGARRVNRMIISALDGPATQFERLRTIHQTGKMDADAMRSEWQRIGIDAIVEPFFNDMASVLRQATLVVSRAGGTTLAELACLGLPSILIPYPNSIGDHQLANAREFEKAEAATIINEEPGAETRLRKAVARLLEQPEQLEAMSVASRGLAKPDAAEAVAAIICRIAE